MFVVTHDFSRLFFAFTHSFIRGLFVMALKKPDRCFESHDILRPLNMLFPPSNVIGYDTGEQKLKKEKSTKKRRNKTDNTDILIEQ